jgi:hypothetical protein
MKQSDKVLLVVLIIILLFAHVTSHVRQQEPNQTNQIETKTISHN